MKFLQDTIEVSAMLGNHESVLRFQLVGSVLIDPATAADLDFLVLTSGSSFLCGDRWAFGPEWALCSGEYSDTDESWGALRLGNVNLICTVDSAWYDRAVKANEVCVALKLKDKGDRIVAYRVIRDGYDAAAANARRDGSR